MWLRLRPMSSLEDGVAQRVDPGLNLVLVYVHDQDGGWRSHREHLDDAREVSAEAVADRREVGLQREARDRDLVKLPHRYLSAGCATARWLMGSPDVAAPGCWRAVGRARTKNSVSSAIAVASEVIVSTIASR
jgi:hypothetical protein